MIGYGAMLIEGLVGGQSATATAAFDPKTTVTQGTLIPAALETAIDTDVPGYVRAIVSSDVRSYDGTRVLVPFRIEGPTPIGPAVLEATQFVSIAASSKEAAKTPDKTPAKATIPVAKTP
jgi:carbon starvation protein CstA